MSGQYITALYLRVSDEDENLSEFCESESISGQRLLLQDFVSRHRELSCGSIIELVDDGFSGTNFDRPGIKKLLEMAKSHQINCIIVKDFSRFGRNYLEVGNYLEQIFPFLGIRFLSVNDHFDSFENMGAAGAIEVGFKNIIHEAYSKDLSEKIKSVRHLKAKQGKFVTAFAPYGYRKAESSKNQLVIDEECAAVVRRIFALSLNGMGSTAIARLLNKEGVPSPLMVRTQRTEKFYCNGCKEPNHWTAGTVSRILSDQRYTGDAVYGKIVPEETGSRKGVRIPQENWIIVSDAHPGIIERKNFMKVQSKKKKYCRGKKTAETDVQLETAIVVYIHLLSLIVQKDSTKKNQRNAFTLYERLKAGNIPVNTYMKKAAEMETELSCEPLSYLNDEGLNEFVRKIGAQTEKIKTIVWDFQDIFCP
jgi:DNA invertase Pin-like site-specific DNA recombinase